MSLLLTIFLIMLVLVDILTHWFDYEYRRYPDANWFNWALYLKSDIRSIAKVLCTKNKVRHVFSPVLWEHIKQVVEPYRNTAFEAEHDPAPCLYDLVPCYELWFVPKEIYDTDKLQEITNLIQLKFRGYLHINALKYRNFAIYQKYDMRICVRIYYAEFEEDTFPYEEQYRYLLKEKSPVDYGALHDEDLDKELNLW